MALVTYPLNNIQYSAEDAELFHCTRTSGVFAADEDFSASVSGADNTVNIGQGIAWIRNSRFSGKVVANKSSVDIDMGLADGTYPRIDAIVIRFDANKNETEIVKKEGSAASSPVAPEVVRTEALYELHLYHVRRRAGATSILASDITDLRPDVNYCGVMSDDVTMLGDDFINKNQIGVAGGVASLGANGKVPNSQLPAMNYIPTSQKGVANGVAPLNASGKVPEGNLPFSIRSHYTSDNDKYDIVTIGNVVVCTGVSYTSGFGALHIYLDELVETTANGSIVPIVLLYNTNKEAVFGYVETSTSGSSITIEGASEGVYHFSFSFVKA